MTPSQLTEGQWIKVTFSQHPDCHLDDKGTPDPDCSTPTGAIIFHVDYSQLTIHATDKNAKPGSEGIPIPISPPHCSEETHRKYANEFLDRLKLWHEQIQITTG